MEARRALITFGHGTAGPDEITSLLGGAGVRLLVDIRTAPGSRRNPHVARRELERRLPEHRVGYRWDKRLGGFRRPPQDSPDLAWREGMFRGYAAHMRTEEFSAAVDDLLADMRTADEDAGAVAVMCSESVWWRCHRRLLADFLVLVRGVPVAHLMHDGRLTGHTPFPAARVRQDGLLVYDAGQASLL
ncbi:DUF488 domain-containing protein [Actinomadura keratinilytica]|uniref:DUF488 domain-containing protein n=1 Tax=Actinomadura keratinilytica TaxID=547461 RepID=A0ABP7Z9L1_9ACTN